MGSFGEMVKGIWSWGIPAMPSFPGGNITAPEGNITLPGGLHNATAGVGGSATPAGASITNTFNISQLVVREEADVDRVADALYRKQQKTGRQAGIA